MPVCQAFLRKVSKKGIHTIFSYWEHNDGWKCVSFWFKIHWDTLGWQIGMKGGAFSPRDGRSCCLSHPPTDKREQTFLSGLRNTDMLTGLSSEVVPVGLKEPQRPMRYHTSHLSWKSSQNHYLIHDKLGLPRHHSWLTPAHVFLSLTQPLPMMLKPHTCIMPHQQERSGNQVIYWVGGL